MYHERCSRVQTKSKLGWKFLDGWLSQPCPCWFCFETCTSLLRLGIQGDNFNTYDMDPDSQKCPDWRIFAKCRFAPNEGPKVVLLQYVLFDWGPLRLVKNPCRSDSWCSCIGTCMLCSNWSSWHSACGQMKINLRIACLGWRLGEFTEAISGKFPAPCSEQGTSTPCSTRMDM